MKKLEPGKLIEHIEEAKDWLNKAETEYQQKNPIRGEMILNLAQAEVKHAWELSHQEFVFTDGNQTTVGQVKRYYFAAVASLVIVATGLLFGTPFAKTLLNSNRPRVILRVPTKDSFVPKIAQSPVKTGTQKLAVPNEVYPVIASKQPELIATDTQPGGKSQTSAITKIVPSPTSVSNETAVDTTKDDRSHETTANSARVQPVTQFSINEEDLTKEASLSLRNGK